MKKIFQALAFLLICPGGLVIALAAVAMAAVAVMVFLLIVAYAFAIGISEAAWFAARVAAARIGKLFGKADRKDREAGPRPPCQQGGSALPGATGTHDDMAARIAESDRVREKGWLQ